MKPLGGLLRYPLGEVLEDRCWSAIADPLEGPIWYPLLDVFEGFPTDLFWGVCSTDGTELDRYNEIFSKESQTSIQFNDNTAGKSGLLALLLRLV